jgi:transposase
MLGAYLTNPSKGQLSLLEKIVPSHHFYHRLANAVDLEFIRTLVAPFYSHTGRPSLDPVVFFKLLLVAHFENITSDRRLIGTASLHIGIRYFLGYDLRQTLPSHSTISRTRQRIPISVFEQCFTHILALCIESGLVAGNVQAIDSAYIKANASLTTMQAKQALWLTDNSQGRKSIPKVNACSTRLRDNQRRVAVNKANSSKKQGRFLSNLTHYSPTDPQARIGYKNGKRRMLCYLSQVSVDTFSHVITYMSCEFADSKDSTYLIPIVDKLRFKLKNFGLCFKTLLADTGYGSGKNYRALAKRGINAYIPAHGKYKADRKGFTYSLQDDSYTCSQGKMLRFDKIYKTQEGHEQKRYMSNAADCKLCPIRKSCIAGTAKEKRLHHTPYKGEYEQIQSRLNTKEGKALVRKRATTVEPVLGSLIEYYGLAKITVRSKASAGKVMLMAAMAYNLKKYMAYTTYNSHKGQLAVDLKKFACFFWAESAIFISIIVFCNSHGTYRTVGQFLK